MNENSPAYYAARAAHYLVRQSKEFYSYVKENGTPEQMKILLDQSFEAVDVMIYYMPRETWPKNPNLKSSGKKLSTPSGLALSKKPLS